STAERGGGLVCWLESLCALIAAPAACNVIFTADSGHELGHLGLDDFLTRRPGWERPISEGGATWIHFGANTGVADGKPSLRSASDDLRQLTEAELVRAGGRCVTLVRSNLLFHLPQERWPAHGRHGRRGPRCRSRNCFGVQANQGDGWLALGWASA